MFVMYVVKILTQLDLHANLENLFMLDKSIHPLLQRKKFYYKIKTLFKSICVINVQLLTSSLYTFTYQRVAHL